jgi:hypothetical protein
MAHMPGSKALWQQHVHWLTDQLRGLIPEQGRCLTVYQHDAAFGVHDDDRIRRRIEEAAELGLSPQRPLSRGAVWEQALRICGNHGSRPLHVDGSPSYHTRQKARARA